MSGQTFAYPGKPYWLSANGTDSVSFNKLTAPPLAFTDKGILYELTDGKLYYNGQEIATGSGPAPPQNRGQIRQQAASLTLTLPLNVDTLCNVQTIPAAIDNFTSPSDGILTYTGTDPIYALVNVDGSAKMAAGSNQEITFYLKKNGSVVWHSQSLTLSGGNMAFAFQCFVFLETNDTLSMYVKNATGANDITFASFCITADGQP